MSDREHLTSALCRINDAGVATVLDLRGSTGVIEDSLDDYRRAAVAANTTDWVGAHVGSRDHGGAHWRNDILLYAGWDQPVRELYFWWNHYRADLGALVAEVMRAEGLNAELHPDGAVVVCLGGAR